MTYSLEKANMGIHYEATPNGWNSQVGTAYNFQQCLHLALFFYRFNWW